MTGPIEDLWGTERVAQHYGIATKQVSTWMHRGLIPPPLIDTGRGGRKRWRSEDVRAHDARRAKESGYGMGTVQA